MTPAPLSPERLKHIRDNYQRLGEAALERHCGDLLAYIDAITAERDRLREALEKSLESQGHYYQRLVEAALERRYGDLLASIGALTVERDKAREKALEEAAKLCDGETVSVRYKSWPCWNPNGNVEKNSDAARLAFCLAVGIRALKEVRP